MQKGELALCNILLMGRKFRLFPHLVIILLLVFIKMTKHWFSTWRRLLQTINLHPGRLDGKKVVFVRRASSGGAPDCLTVDTIEP